MSLFEKLRNRNKQNEQTINESEKVKKPTLTEQLGLPFGLNEIEYISIITTFDKDIFYLAVSNREQLKVLTHTHSTSQNQIISRLEDLKTYFKPYGNYVNLGEGLPLINLHKIKGVNLIYDEPDENNNKRNHVIIFLSNGQTYHTKPETCFPNKINKNEFINFTFWSNRNEHLYGK
ncbi:MAG: hypothetical protein IJ415_02295 [Clostridia bacterium]|nr:hypothetical protein [Clostridia bacterium]